MTAKDKANRLHTLMYGKFESGVTWEEAKRCALICVNEVRDNLPLITDIQNYWIEIKNEIEKL